MGRPIQSEENDHRGDSDLHPHVSLLVDGALAGASVRDRPYSARQSAIHLAYTGAGPTGSNLTATLGDLWPDPDAASRRAVRGEHVADGELGETNFMKTTLIAAAQKTLAR